MLLYAAPIWIEATKKNWCKSKLRSIQRLTLMTTIRSFRTISTKSALILSNTIPLEMRAQNLSTQYFIRRSNSQTAIFHIKDNKVLSEILQSCSIVPSQLDIPRKSLNAEKRLNNIPVIIHSQTYPNPELSPRHPNDIYFFTDGSKTDKGVASATILTNCHGIRKIYKNRLPPKASIFEAEVFGILTALSVIDKLKDTPNSISIFSDSQAVLQLLNSSSQVSHLMYKIQKLAVDITHRINIKFIWVPGHSNIDGNEVADRVAKDTANNPNIPVSEMALNWTSTKPILAEYFNRKWDREWVETTESSATTKMFFPTVASSHVLKHIYLPHSTIQILSGHSQLNSFLNLIQVVDDPLCACCNVNETTNHFLFHCPLYHSQRMKLKKSCKKACNVWPPPLHVLVSSSKLLVSLRSFTTESKRLNFIP